MTSYHKLYNCDKNIIGIRIELELSEFNWNYQQDLESELEFLEKSRIGIELKNIGVTS